MNPITSSLVAVLVLAGVAIGQWVNLYLSLPLFVGAIVLAMSLRMANAWQKFVILEWENYKASRERECLRSFPSWTA